MFPNRCEPIVLSAVRSRGVQNGGKAAVIVGIQLSALTRPVPSGLPSCEKKPPCLIPVVSLTRAQQSQSCFYLASSGHEVPPVPPQLHRVERITRCRYLQRAYCGISATGVCSYTTVLQYGWITQFPGYTPYWDSRAGCTAGICQTRTSPLQPHTSLELRCTR